MNPEDIFTFPSRKKKERQETLKLEDNPNVVHVYGWKGKDDISIWEGDDVFYLEEHRKEKDTDDVKTSVKVILKTNVKMLWDIIKGCEYGVPYGYRWLVKKIIEKKSFHVLEKMDEEIMIDRFNGGRFRAKYYFPYYYYPVKVLEAKQMITYHGRGGFTRIEHPQWADI